MSDPQIVNRFYELIVDTDSYAGNIERPLAAYLFGVDEYRTVPEYIAARSEADAEELVEFYDAEKKGGILQLFTDPAHEYPDWAMILPTPAELLSDEEKAKGHPIYNSVLMRLDRLPTPTEHAVIKRMLAEFPARHYEIEDLRPHSDANRVEILGVRWRLHQETVEEISL